MLPLGPRSRDMTISLFEARGVRFELLSEEEIADFSAPGPKKQKSKDTLLSQILKVEERKCPIVLLKNNFFHGT